MEEAERTGERGSCGQGILYKRRICFPFIKKKKEERIGSMISSFGLSKEDPRLEIILSDLPF